VLSFKEVLIAGCALGNSPFFLRVKKSMKAKKAMKAKAVSSGSTAATAATTATAATAVATRLPSFMLQIESDAFVGSYGVCVSEDSTVYDVKRQIAEDSCWDEASMELWRCGVPLRDDSRLVDYSIDVPMTLHMSKKAVPCPTAAGVDMFVQLMGAACGAIERALEATADQ
jgi:hypothetical protein